MTYQETIDFLYSRLPVFHQIGARAFKPGLHTTQEFCKLLGNPETKYPSIHVGGTNGKGSTSHMLASVLSAAGYKVGLYTSPHLKSFTERIRINGAAIQEKFIVEFVADNLSNIDRFEPSFFELTVAMAFSYFATQEIDIAVIEVGMGGRLDSTNVIQPVLSVITNVSFDHTQFLGDTLPKIAAEKAGIIKYRTPVVVSERQNNAIADVFEAAAEANDAELTFASDRFSVNLISVIANQMRVEVTDLFTSEIAYKELDLDLSGSYQSKNLAGVLTTIEELKRNGFSIEADAVVAGLKDVTNRTGLKGRWQKLGDFPAVYCDTAHNFAGLTETIRQFSQIPSTCMRFVIGFVGDKDISAMLELFPKDGKFYFCQPSNQRALPAADLHRMAGSIGLMGVVYQNVNEALEGAKNDSAKSDSIYVGGSTFVVADLDEL
jgi:dihydrofolate synthase/folylpolyglutamate synthase